MLDWFKKKSLPPVGPDFSGIDSQEKAEELFRLGQLEKVFLIPLEFGGQDNSDNYLFVPIGVPEIKAGIDNNVIRPLIEDGTVSQYSATPEYQGASFIPIALKIVASNPGSFTTEINMWGEALGRG